MGYNTKGGRLERIITGLARTAKAGLLVVGLAISYTGIKNYAQVPGLPINYWDSPSGCTTCDPSRGAFRDGLHFLDNSLIEFMMDCDGNGSRESNVNRSSFQRTLMSGAYDILVYAETATECGYNALSSTRNKGDARIDGLVAYPKGLVLVNSGTSIQQRLDTYTSNLRLLASIVLDWMPGNPEANVPGGGYDVVRGSIDNLKASNGLGGATVIPIVCNTPSTGISSTREIIEDPAIGTSFFYVVRPRSPTETGNYGRTSAGIARNNPAVGDCPP